MFNGLFDKLGSLRTSKLISWITLAIVPVVAVIGLIFVGGGLFAVLWEPAAREVTRNLGPQFYLLLPGINPFLPIVYGWIAIICAIAVHEGAHGIIARNRGVRVKSSGLLFVLIFPIGAFVDVDEKQLEKTKARDSLRVLAGGVGGNIIVALVCILSVFLIVNGLTPAIDGVYISETTDGMPAQAAGLMAEDVFVSIDNTEIVNLEELTGLLEEKDPGDVVQVTVARGEKWEDRFSTSVNLTESEGRTVMGVIVGDLEIGERLRFYQEWTLEKSTIYMVPPSLIAGAVPFTDSLAQFYTHDMGPQWQIWTNVLFWLWFVNVYVAFFNALPIYPFDGGRMFNITLKSLLGRRIGEKNVSRITIAVTITLIWVLLMTALIPFIL